MDNNNMNQQMDNNMNQQMNNQYQPNNVKPKNAKATISLVIAIISLILFPAAIVLGPVAILLGVLSKDKNIGKRPGKGKAGIVIGTISFLFFWFVVGLGAAFTTKFAKITPYTSVYRDKSICLDVRNGLVNVVKNSDAFENDILSLMDNDLPLEDVMNYLSDSSQARFFKYVKLKSVKDINNELCGKGHIMDNSTTGIYVRFEEDDITVYIPNSCEKGKGAKCDNKEDIISIHQK